MGSRSKRSAKQSARAPAPAAAQSHACATPPKKTGPRAAPFALRAVFEQLEPRLLLSADLNPLATEALLATPTPASGSEFRALTDPGHPSAVTAAAVAPVQRTHELVFIDPRVPDRDQLLAGLTGQSTDGRRFEVIVLDTTRDGIAQVTAALAERIQIDAIHFISHGTDGAVQLGRTWLDAKTLAANAEAVASWGESLKRDADLLFYGCDLAASARGRALVEWIAELTRGDIAASTDVTGSAALGGDWDLEYRRGQIETPLAPSAAGLSVWQGTLAQTFYLGGDATPPFSDLETAAPTDASWDGSNNYDPGRDAEPGLLIKKDNASASQSDTEKHHTWTALAPAGGIVIANEQVTLAVWSAMKDNDPDKKGTITAYLLDMASATATSGTQIAQATVPLKPWSANFAEEVLDFGIFNHTVAAGRYLGVKLVVGNTSDDDLWFAYDATAYPSRLEIGASNAPPVAIAASASGNEDEAQIAITLTAADLEGPVASFRLNGLPANGLLYADAGLTTLAAIATDYAAAGNALTLYFVPAANWNGTTSFQFTAVDGGGLADATPGNATINVAPLNDAPAGTDGAVATLMNTPRVLAAADFGFTDPDAGDSMSAVRIDGLPLLGTLSVGGIPLLLPGAVVTAAQLAAGDLVFTPLLLTSGTPYASFDFSVADAASVFDPTRNVLTINVLFVNSPPDGTNTSVTTNEDTPYALAVANFGFTDPDAGDSLGAVRIDVLPTAGVLTLLGTPVTPGQIVLAADIAAGRLVFTPAPDASGAPYASFTFSVRDSNGAFDTTANLLTLTVSPVNDPPVAADNAYAVSEDAILSVPLASAAVLANDTDVDGPALSAVLVAGPANGVLALAPNGTFTYTPNADFYGTDTFTYRAFDGSASSNVATVTITINNVADNTLVVDTAADTVNGDTTSIDALLANKGVDGLVSLREAILAANATANAGTPDLIHFSIAGSGPHTIALAATLPQITDAAVIDGTTEPDFTGTPVIVLDGNGGAGNGLRLAANGSTVRGLAIVDFGQAGVLVSGTGNTIEGNYIGIAADGVTAAGNQTYGVRVNAGGNVIGGTTAAQRNVISGNRIDGLYIAGGSGNVVQGNYVGTNAAGTAAVANLEDGIWIDGGSNTIVGGTALGEGNLLSGNAWSGIALSGSSAGTVILGNRIGLDAAGTGAIANQRHGVDLGSFSGATVGGTAAGAANVIAFNRIEGVSVAAGTGHSILGNSIFANGGLGIDLIPGANSDMNAPVIYSVTVSGGTVTIAGEARPGATVEFFEADPDPSGRGEGRTLLGSGVVSGAVAGAVDPTARRFTFTFPVGSIAVGDRLTATATDGSGSTSEFAVNVVANALPPGIAITPIGGLVTTEDGGIAEFLVVLESEPAADVTIAFSTSDATEGTVAPASLTFTALNWSVAQIVTVTGVADFLTDGAVAYSLVAAAVTSADPGYSGLDPADIALTNVDGVNEAPVNSVPSAQSTAEDSALVFTGPLAFSIADSDLGSGLAQVSLAGTNGTLTLGGTAGLSFSVGDGMADASMTFTGTIAAVNTALAGMSFLPALDFTGSAAGITITTSDQGGSGAGGAQSDTDSVTISVTAVNDAPVATADTATTPEDTPLVIAASALTANDTDVEGQPLSVISVQGAVNGAVSLAAGTITFTPTANYNGPASFTYTIDDGNGGTATATVNVTVTAVNDAPVANNVVANGSEDDPQIAVTLTASDVDGAVASFRLASVPANGALYTDAGLTLLAVAGTDYAAAGNTLTLYFVPAANWNGSTGFQFTATDGGGLSDATPANAMINVAIANDVPLAAADAAATNENTPVTTADVLVNDSLGDQPTTIVAFDAASAQGGTVVLGAGNAFTYTPAAAFSGTDTFTYTIRDSDGETSTATVTVTVANVANDAPVNIVPGAQIAAEDASLVFSLGTGNLLAISDPDAGANPLEVTLTAANGTLTLAGTAGLTFTVGTGAADATMTFTGTQAAINATLNGLVFTPNLDYNGLAFIQLTTNDLGASGAGGPLTDTDLAMIDVFPVNDAPNGTDTTVTLNEDSTYTFTLGDFGFNDVDLGDAMTEVRIDSISLPAGATLQLGGVDVLPTQVIAVGDITAGLLVFTPVPDANGAGYASFTFSVRDTGVPPGPLFDLAPNSMTVNVTPVNDLPVITSDGGGATAAFVVAENTTAVTTAAATDIDLQPLAFSLAGVDAGLFSIDSVTGVLTFNATPNFEAPGDTGGDNVYDVTVVVSDGAGGIDTQALTVTVTDANDAPVASDDAYVTDEDLPLSIAAAGVLVNDGDEDGTPVTAVLVAGPANGAVAFNADGSFVYTPKANFFGVDAFTYQATDGAVGSALATVTITVNPINDAPSAADGNVTILAAYAFSVADFNYFDVDGDPLDRIRITALPVEGQLLFDGLAVTLDQEITAGEVAAGRLTYVPPTTSSATAASFGFSVSDGALYEAASHTMTIGFASGAGTLPPAPPPPPTITPPPAPPADPAAEPPADGEPAEPGGGATASGGGRGGGSGGGESAAPPAPPAPEGAPAPVETAQAAAGVVASAAPQVGSAPAGSIGFQSSGVAANPNIAAPALPADQRGEPPVGEVKAEMEAVAAMTAPEVRQALDEMRERAQEDVKLEARVAGSVFVVSTGLSVGYVLWLLRGGALIASLLSSLPAWRLVDPLPVLGSMGGRAGDEDDDSLEDLVADNGPPSAPGEDALADNDNVGSVRT